MIFHGAVRSGNGPCVCICTLMRPHFITVLFITSFRLNPFFALVQSCRLNHTLTCDSGCKPEPAEKQSFPLVGNRFYTQGLAEKNDSGQAGMTSKRDPMIFSVSWFPLSVSASAVQTNPFSPRQSASSGMNPDTTVRTSTTRYRYSFA